MRVRIDRLSVVYEKGEVTETVGLHPVAFELESGNPIVLNGPNGCGKSTLLRVLGGLIRDYDGEISLITPSDRRILSANWLRANSRYMHQQPLGGLFADLTIAENTALLLPEASWFDPYFPSRKFHDKEEELQELVPFYSSHKTHRLPELSGGQQQLFAIGCAGVTRKRILLFDEPTSALDPVATQKAEKLLRTLCFDTDTFSIVVTHDSRLARELGFESSRFEDITM